MSAVDHHARANAALLDAAKLIEQRLPGESIIEQATCATAVAAVAQAHATLALAQEVADLRAVLADTGMAERLVEAVGRVGRYTGNGVL